MIDCSEEKENSVIHGFKAAWCSLHNQPYLRSHFFQIWLYLMIICKYPKTNITHCRLGDYGALFRPTLSGSRVLSHSFNNFEKATKSSSNDFSWVSLTFYEPDPTIFHTECSPPIHSMTSPRLLNAPILPARLLRSSGYTWETLRALRGRYEVHPNTQSPVHSMNSPRRSCRQHGGHYERNPERAIILNAAEKRWICETRIQKREWRGRGKGKGGLDHCLQSLRCSRGDWLGKNLFHGQVIF